MCDTPAAKPVVTITYCIGCNWLLRAGWMAQELLQTFKDDLGGVTLVPGEIGGVFVEDVELAAESELSGEAAQDIGEKAVEGAQEE